MHAFEVLDYVSVIHSLADFRDTEEPYQFLFRHNGRTGQEFAVWARQDGRQVGALLHGVHGCSLDIFLPRIDQKRGGLQEKNGRVNSRTPVPPDGGLKMDLRSPSRMPQLLTSHGAIHVIAVFRPRL
jgi:hypothetical protein